MFFNLTKIQDAKLKIPVLQEFPNNILSQKGLYGNFAL